MDLEPSKNEGDSFSNDFLSKPLTNQNIFGSLILQSLFCYSIYIKKTYMALSGKKINGAADWHNLYDTFNSNNNSFTKQVYHISSTISHAFRILLHFSPICQRFHITVLKDQIFLSVSASCWFKHSVSGKQTGRIIRSSKYHCDSRKRCKADVKALSWQFWLCT